MLKTLIILTVISIFYGNVSSQPIQKEPVYNWVNEVEIPMESAISKYDVSSGVYFKLIDYQVLVEEDKYYSHFAQHVVSGAGVSNASQIEITYDSSYQNVVFHHLTILRKGQKIDRTNEINFEFIKNEQDLQSNIYSGDVTALAILQDIRRDDIIEYAYTLIGSNPVFDDMVFYSIPLEDINPLDRISVRVIYPKEEPLSYKCEKCLENELVVYENANNVELLIDRKNLEAFEIEETMAPWNIPYAYLMVSSTDSWQQVNDWAVEIFDNHAIDQVNSVLSELFQPEFSTEDKINAIIDFVQDEIRYMGIETGIGSIKPFSPNQVIKQRFGDCKDKSLLISEMLRAIGVNEAYPALVSSRFQHYIDKFIPSGHVFDHCIVYFEYDSSSYWVDATYSYQGGDFKSMTTYDYQRALVVKPNQDSLVSMNLVDSVSMSSLVEILDASSYSDPASLKVHTTLSGNRADFTRQLLEYYSTKDLAEIYRHGYGIVYPSLYEESKIRVSDDPSLNVMKVDESYTIPEIWDGEMEGYDGKWVLSYEPTAVYGYFVSMNCEKTEHPVLFEYPSRLSQTTRIILPETISAADELKEYDNAAFKFTKRLRTTDDNKVEFKYSYLGKTKEVSSEDFVDVCHDMNEIMNNLPTVIYFPKNKPEVDFSNLPIDVYQLKIKKRPLKLEGSPFYIVTVEDKRKKSGEIIGLVNAGVYNKPAIAIAENGLEVKLGEYLIENQEVPEEGIALKIMIKEFFISEKKESRGEKAILNFKYEFSYVIDGKEYISVYSDIITADGVDVTGKHEENIRKSLSQALGSLTPDDFVINN